MLAEMKQGFIIGQTYTRMSVMSILGITPLPKGGAWFTGLVKHGDEYFIFCGVNTGGRTGHHYGNRFEGDELVWSGKNGSLISQPSIVSILKPGTVVHIFYRYTNTSPFVYGGEGRPLTVLDSSPVIIRWALHTAQGGNTVEQDFAERQYGQTYMEGSTQRKLINAYERHPAARAACIAYHGLACKVCGLVFGERYGALGEGFIHIHHLRPLASIREQYEIDPIKELVPVCANCHAMIHRADPPLSIEHLRSLLICN